MVATAGMVRQPIDETRANGRVKAQTESMREQCLWRVVVVCGDRVWGWRTGINSDK